jgi:hypothetical protein
MLGLNDVTFFEKDNRNRRIPTYRDEFHRGTYVGKSRNFYFYSVRNRLELSIGDDIIVKYYKGDLSNSFYTKWEWFKNLPTVKQFIEQHNK